MIRLATAAAALLLSAAPALAQSADNKVVLTFETGARTGMVMVALYDTAAAFDGNSARPVAATAVRYLPSSRASVRVSRPSASTSAATRPRCPVIRSNLAKYRRATSVS